MSNDPNDPTSDARWLMVREWREPGQYIRCALDHHRRGAVYFEGRGSMEGARALLRLLDDMRLELGPDITFSAIVDLRDLTKSPLRAQFLIGKWLFKHKHQVEKVATFGGKPLEMRIARAVMTIARMKNASFFNHLDEALAWLQWPAGVYP